MKGRGHCAQCFTPWGCYRDTCPCHGDHAATCRADGCTAPLYSPPPKPLSFRDVFRTEAA